MKQTYSLGALDRKILAVVQRDALVAQAELAEQVGSSAASCWRRVRAMEEAGVIRAAVRLVEPSLVGLGVTVLCNIRVRSHAREVRRSFEEFVRDKPQVMECYSMSGDWDYLLRIVAADVADYEDFLMHVLLDHPAVGGASSHFALSTTKYTTELPVG